MMSTASLCLILAVCIVRITANFSPNFNGHVFRGKIDAALEKTRQLLQAAKDPVRFLSAEDVPHVYEDKYVLAEFLAHSASRSSLNLLRQLGATNENIKDMIEWAKTDYLILQFTAEQRCSFDHWAVRKEESPTQSVEIEVDGKVQKTTSRKTTTSVNESFWKIELSYELRVVGRAAGHSVTVAAGGGEDMLATPSHVHPYPDISPLEPINLDLKWLLSNVQLVNAREGIIEDVAVFKIDRSCEHTKTPRRNKELDAAMDFFSGFFSWGRSVNGFFMNEVLSRVRGKRNLNLAQIISTDNVFVPVLPIFKDGDSECSGSESNSTCSLLPDPSIFELFLEEENRTIMTKVDNLGKWHTGKTGIITFPETRLMLLAVHATQIAQFFSSGIDYVEEMLHRQLSAAVGKELSSEHLVEYMDHHNSLLFAPEYAPKPFSYAVRRSVESSPEGQIAIESDVHVPGSDISIRQVKTMAHKLDNQVMEIPLSAATSVRFGGDRYVHAWLHQSFSGSLDSFYISASARQFSSFILVLGRVSSATTIDPTYAVVVKDKDFLRIPLNMEIIPSAKEFRDATQSLSPEQQEFAKAFRSMQLSSTLFAVCTIQIKPQLEKVLNLRTDSLTKEIKLTQDLMELFIEYQIPSDLLSFSGDLANASVSERIASVQSSVQAMKDMIVQSKEELVKESELANDFKNPRQRKSGRESGIAMAEMAFDSPNMMFAASSAPVGYPSSIPSSAPSHEPSSAPSSFGLRGGQTRATVADGVSDASSVAGSKLGDDSSVPTSSTPVGTSAASATSSALDLTSIPTVLDTNFDKYCNGSVLRSAVLNPGFPWSRTRQKNLLSPPVKVALHEEETSKEKTKAFELLDALTKSGGLMVDHASLHIIIAAQHSFDKSLTNTIIKDNINPIKKLELSALTAAATVHGLPIQALLRSEHHLRLDSANPLLSSMNEHRVVAGAKLEDTEETSALREKVPAQ